MAGMTRVAACRCLGFGVAQIPLGVPVLSLSVLLRLDFVEWIWMILQGKSGMMALRIGSVNFCYQRTY